MEEIIQEVKKERCLRPKCRVLLVPEFVLVSNGKTGLKWCFRMMNRQHLSSHMFLLQCATDGSHWEVLCPLILNLGEPVTTMEGISCDFQEQVTNSDMVCLVLLGWSFLGPRHYAVRRQRPHGEVFGQQPRWSPSITCQIAEWRSLQMILVPSCNQAA